MTSRATREYAVQCYTHVCFLKLISPTFIKGNNTQPFTAVLWLERSGRNREAIRKGCQMNAIFLWCCNLHIRLIFRAHRLCCHFSAFYTQLRILQFATYLDSLLFSVLGTVGFFACFFYVRRIYSNISLPEKPVTTWMVKHCTSHYLSTWSFPVLRVYCGMWEPGS